MSAKMMLTAFFVIVPLVLSQSCILAMGSNDNKKTINAIEEAEDVVDTELGATEGIKPKPVKRELSPKSDFESAFQARSGFQQQPEITTAEQRR